ncbi:MAG TPA: glycosyltransferase family 2 protein [Lacunisphaera sp.]|jgi:glycosyltransferase involved in cell wall biosynthesis
MSTLPATTAVSGDPIDVSVIIPTYNRLWCLPRAVASCRGTKCATQIIVCDDGSTDGTWEWLQTQPDLVAVKQNNQGQTWAINRATRDATGRYVRFLDSDDYLLPGIIDRQFAAAESSGADVTYSRVDIREEETGAVEQYPDPPLWEDFTAVMLGEGYGSHFLGMMFRRSFVEDIPRRPEFALREDRAFLLEVALKNPKLAAVEGCAGYWTRHGRQMHTGYQGLQTTVAACQMWKLYERALTQLEARGELTPRRARAASQVLWRASHAIARSHLTDALALVARIRQIDPQFIPTGESPTVRRLYALLGFAGTQYLFRVRRWFFRQIR